MKTVKAYSSDGPKSSMAPFTIQRRDPGPSDVQLDILYCGVCHSDLHTVRNEWHNTIYPCVPGHEIIGRITGVGRDVKNFKEGDIGAVGCMVDSEGECSSCREGLEQYCEQGATYTYNSEDKISGGMTYGGYTESIVVDKDFVLRVPSRLELASAAPLLCAGITTYSPLRHWNVQKGQKVGIVGLGGLGHMAVKFARAFGAHVVLFTTSTHKKEDALRLGAHEVVISKNPDEMNRHLNSFDFILNTVSADHDMNILMELLKRDKTLCLVGAPENPQGIAAMGLLTKRRSLSGSGIGGIRETQEMLDFCAENGVACDIEMIRIQQINEAYERLLKSDVKYRFVIDMSSLK